METLTGLLDAIGRLSGVTLSTPVYGVVSVLHILGIALLIGGILLVDLRLAGLLRHLDDGAARLLRILARVGAGLAVVTGVLLLSARPGEYLANRIFLAKMVVVGLALINALAFEWLARRRTDVWPAGPYARTAGLVSLTGWLAALMLGRWIAFT
ncbi:DUF2214 domain-containing protein [Phreatobacter sp. HK31-P]